MEMKEMAQIRAETAAAAENEIARTSENQENATPMVRLVNSIIERAFLEAFRRGNGSPHAY